MSNAANPTNNSAANQPSTAQSINDPINNAAPGPAKTDTGSTDSTTEKPLVDESEISGSMHTEEPTGWDQAPQSIDNPRHKRHPRPDGVGAIEPSKHKDRASDRI